MNNPASPIETLRQLKEMLDAGALTPTEFEALKQRLVFGSTTPTPDAPAGAPPPAAPAGGSGPSLPLAEPQPPLFDNTAAAEPPLGSPTAPAWTSEPPVTNAPRPAAYTPEPLPDPEPELEPEPAWTGHEFTSAPPEPARNPLALILSIGGVLVFLAVVAYLTLNRPPSEHISSTSQTAADSLAAPIETGPQVAHLPEAAAQPETVRVAPTNPAPPIPSRPAPAVRDSIAAPVLTAPTDSAASQ